MGVQHPVEYAPYKKFRLMELEALRITSKPIGKQRQQGLRCSYRQAFF